MLKTIKELEALLASHLDRAKQLEADIASWEEKIKEAKAEHRNLMGFGGGTRGGGLLSNTKADLALVRRYQSDLLLPHPVFTKGYDKEEDYCIVKVTPKRLYIRNIGSSRDTIVNIAYPESSYFWTCNGLDIEATIERYNQHGK